MSGCHNPTSCRCICHGYAGGIKVECPFCECRSIVLRIEQLERTLKDLVDKIANMANYYYRERVEPFKCPVCEGKRQACMVCKDKGIIWK